MSTEFLLTEGTLAILSVRLDVLEKISRLVIIILDIQKTLLPYCKPAMRRRRDRSADTCELSYQTGFDESDDAVSGYWQLCRFSRIQAKRSCSQT